MPENDNKKELDSSITAWFDSLLTELGNGKKIIPEDEEDRKRKRQRAFCKTNGPK